MVLPALVVSGAAHVYSVHIFRVYKVEVNPRAKRKNGLFFSSRLPTTASGLEHGRGFLAGCFAAGLATQHACQLLQPGLLAERLDGRRRAVAAPFLVDRPVMPGI